MSNHRLTAVIEDNDYERVRYWAEKKGMSMNDYVRYAVLEAIKREYKDYDIPTMEIARLNQLVDSLSALSFNVGNLEHIVSSGFDSLFRLTRGDNYLMDDDEEYVSNEI